MSAVLLLVGLILSAAPTQPVPVEGPGPTSPAPPPVPARTDPAPLTLRQPLWHELVAAVTERKLLTAALADLEEIKETGVFLFVGEVVPGVGQPAFDYYGLGDSAFVSSVGRYNVASAAKLAASVGALHALRKRGLTGAARVRVGPEADAFVGGVRDLIQLALIYSDNSAYNWLLRIAGHDELNSEVLNPAYGTPRMALQSLYGKDHKGETVGDSPEITAWEAGVTVHIPARPRRLNGLGCGGNCTSLYEMQEVLRRVTLHWELPVEERYDLDPADVYYLRQVLLHARDGFGNAPRRALGAQAQVYSRFGNVPGLNFFDTALIDVGACGPGVTDWGMAVNAPRYLFTLALPYENQDQGMHNGGLERVQAVTEAALRALAQRERKGPLAQQDAGVPIELSVTPDPGAPRRVIIRASAGPNASVRAWVGRQPLFASRAVGGSTVVYSVDQPGDQVLVAEAWQGGRRVGYRAVLFSVE
jgi:hypothetical protein